MDLNSHVFIRPQWLFFDLDDTLWDFSANSLISLNHVYGKYPVIARKFPVYDDFLHEYHIHNSKMWKDFAMGLTTSEKIKTERWRLTLFPDSKSEDCKDFCSEINSEYLNFLALQPNPVEGAADLIRNLSSEFMIGVISNGFSDTQYKKINNSGLWKHITRIIVSDEIGIQKPFPQIFKYVESETGCSSSPIFVGDNPDTDILGALNAGWRAIWFSRDGVDFPYSDTDLKSKGIDPDLMSGTARSMKDVESLIRMHSCDHYLKESLIRGIHVCDRHSIH